MTKLTRVTTIPFRLWPWHRRALERLYRATHGGQVRTIVIAWPRGFDCSTVPEKAWVNRFAGRCYFYPTTRDCPEWHPGGICGRTGERIPEGDAR